MWNLKKHFLIGCTLYVHMFCCGTVAAENTTIYTSHTLTFETSTSIVPNNSSTSDIGSTNSSTLNPDSFPTQSNSTYFSTRSLDSYISVTKNSNPILSESARSDSNTFVTTSSNVFVQTSLVSDTPVLTSFNSITPVLASSYFFTPVLARPVSDTPVLASSNSFTSALASYDSFTPVLASSVSFTPVHASSNSLTPVVASSDSFTPVLASSISFTPVLASSNSFTPVVASSNSFTPVVASSYSFTPALASSNSFTPVLASSISFTPVIASSYSFTPVVASSSSFKPVLASSNSFTPVLASSYSFSSVPITPSSYTHVVGSSFYSSLPVSPHSSQSVTTSPKSVHKNGSHATEETDTTVVLSKDTVPVKVKLVVKIDKPFKSALTKKTSPLYKNYTTEFKAKLVDVYKTMKNFLRIDVIGFRNGSTICDYAVILTPGSFTDTGKDDFKELQTQTAKLNGIGIFDSVMISPNSSIAKVLQENNWSTSCYGIDCGSGYSCDKVVDDSVTCKHICATSNKCQHGAECLFDPRHEQPHCRCKQDSNYMYSGNYCEVKVEKFTMSKTNIIAIAAGAGGGVVLLLMVVIVALGVKYRRRQTGKQRDGKPDSLRSVSMDDLRFEPGNSSRSSDGFLKRPKIHAAENPYQSGLPETKYVQGREHKVMKDYTGQETYLYQPSDHVKRSSESSVASSSYTDHINKYVHDYIDTDSKFEIQRPNIRPGYLDKF